ncbi:MAG: HlyD family efflux transporter periplasmic adaptor subunit [Vicinamibacteria bacterium]
MDIARPDLAVKRKKRNLQIGAGAAVVLLSATWGLSQLKPAAPTVDRGTLFLDKVKKGEMLLQVRGLGTLVPEEVRWIPAQTQARVERIVALPGTIVKPDTIILEMSNTDLETQVLDAESQLREAEARLIEARSNIERGRLDQQSAAARVESEARQARLQADADAELSRQGLVASLNAARSKAQAEELESRAKVEQQRLKLANDSLEAQIAVPKALVEQRLGTARMRRAQLGALKVRAGINGVLQSVPVEVGQQVSPGTNLARVVEPTKLKAVIRVAETQAKDLAIGLPCDIDTRNGIVKGKVTRIDPAAQNGTVAVDVALEGELPKGARPDLTVDGTIELARLNDTLYVGRPAQGAGESTISLFRVDPLTGEAHRVRVQLGRASVNSVQILDGLSLGDEVILSDASAWDAFDRIRLK